MKLFRYRRASINTLSELAEGLAWYSKYDQLNDPFEGAYINLSGEVTFDDMIQQLRVCCFSRKHDCLLLWAHYAENHRGLCLEYEVLEDVFRSQFFPVKYSRTQPILDEVRRYPQGMSAAGLLQVSIDREALVFSTKSIDWSYEEEYRNLVFAKHPDCNGEKHPVPGILTAIYFGLRADTSTIMTVDKILHNQPNVSFWQASLIPNQFQLQFCPIQRKLEGCSNMQ